MFGMVQDPVSWSSGFAGPRGRGVGGVVDGRRFCTRSLWICWVFGLV